MKLLLINPRFPESFWSFSWALEEVVREKQALNSPLGLATLAGLTPDGWEITLIDENVEPIDWSAEADVVGVCGMGVQFPRQKEILQHFRRKGCFVVAGGAYASLCPEEYADLADVVIAGEAENIWPQFCRDFAKGDPQKLYHETGEVDITTSPVPRFDLLKLDKYQKVSIQFSRGCPFLCEFCDIIVMFGRKPRTKSFEQVEQELEVLRAHGVKSVFFVDDNLIGNLPQARKLLAFLTEYQKKHDFPFTFGTEASLNMASEPKLMEAFKTAHFEWVFIGLESPSEESLAETKKNQNLRGDMLSNLRTIYSYGIDIMAGFIIGFDHDDQTIFERQYKFIMESGIAVSMVGLLVALPKTPLFKRLAAAGRLASKDTTPDGTRPYTNIVPEKMTQAELVEGYQQLLFRLRSDKNIHERLLNKVKYLKDPPTTPYLTWRQKLAYFSRLLIFGILPGGPKRMYYFTKSFFWGLAHPQSLPIILTDWIASISLKNFGDRYKRVPGQAETTLATLKQKLLTGIATPLERGWMDLRLSVLQNRPHIWIDLNQPLDSKAVRVLYRTLSQTLKVSRQAVVLDLHQLKENQLQYLITLLKKLRRYHEQIQIQISETLYPRLKDQLMFFRYSLVAA